MNTSRRGFFGLLASFGVGRAIPKVESTTVVQPILVIDSGTDVDAVIDALFQELPRAVATYEGGYREMLRRKLSSPPQEQL